MMHFLWIIWRILIYPNEPLRIVEEIVRQEVEQDKKGEIQYSRRTHAVHEGRGKWPSAKKCQQAASVACKRPSAHSWEGMGTSAWQLHGTGPANNPYEQGNALFPEHTSRRSKTKKHWFHSFTFQIFMKQLSWEGPEPRAWVRPCLSSQNIYREIMGDTGKGFRLSKQHVPI